SARFCGIHGDDAANRKLLLEKLDGKSDRRAKFVSATVLCRADGSYLAGNGETCGNIGFEENGENGFGYDSLFVSDDLGKTFAEATDEEKNSVSHRYRALIDLLKKL
ncbi:MAG: non-canonical purine NTP pyrophosphatase, partial [Clostridia bacterium]|nr:non-canonical purine NTP pyrophosphatase [Clostridia bacterium]